VEIVTYSFVVAIDQSDVVAELHGPHYLFSDVARLLVQDAGCTPVTESHRKVVKNDRRSHDILVAVCCTDY